MARLWRRSLCSAWVAAIYFFIGIINTSHADIALTLPVSSHKNLLNQEVVIGHGYVSDFARKGLLVLSSKIYYQGTEIYRYPEDKQAIDQLNQRKQQDRLMLSGLPVHEIKVGDRLENIKGRVVALQPITIAVADFRLRPSPVEPPYQHSTRELKFSLLNLENYFNGEQGRFSKSRGAKHKTQFKRQHNKLVVTLQALNSDVIALNEIENDGNGSDSAIHELSEALTRATGNPYRFIKTGHKLGSDAITVGQIYRSDRVRPVGAAHSLSFDYLHRPLLLQQYQFQGNSLYFATTHLKSKAGKCRSDRKEKLYFAACNQQRVKASKKILSYLSVHTQGTITGLPQLPVILMADLNSYAKEPPLLVFENAGFRRAWDLAADKPLAAGYRFQGAMGNLDHALLNAAAQAVFKKRTSWAINSLYSDSLGYRHLKSDSPALATPIRSSDHDPLSIVVNFD